jgi:small subunit ribosomal protein S4
MARYTGPKARINRRLGTLIYESGGAVRAMERRDNPPGMHTRPRRPSNYGLALREKQKIKHYYGLGERQLRRLFNTVAHKKGATGEMLLLLTMWCVGPASPAPGRRHVKASPMVTFRLTA